MEREERKMLQAKIYDIIHAHFEPNLFDTDATAKASKLSAQIMQAIDESGASFSEKIINQRVEEQNLDDPHFHGPVYKKEIDQKRLTKQMLKIFAFMMDDEWHTLYEISINTEAPEASISAALRAMTRKEWGGHTKLRERVAEHRGLYRYKIIPNKESLTFQSYLDSLMENAHQL